ncbi:MAG: hypothetical protein CM15mL2_0470 [Caudoviricetes sp.]|nr:MAG: hypothetical protein CM15mL2_0470 [Caudoviricetes sp.]
MPKTASKKPINLISSYSREKSLGEAMVGGGMLKSARRKKGVKTEEEKKKLL